MRILLKTQYRGEDGPWVSRWECTAKCDIPELGLAVCAGYNDKSDIAAQAAAIEMMFKHIHRLICDGRLIIRPSAITFLEEP